MLRAALFDMDRTLVRRETASLYIRYQREIGEATFRDAARVLLWVTQYTFGIIDAQEAAKTAARSLRGMPETVLAARLDDWFRRDVEKYMADRGRQAVAFHRAKGELLAIVTTGSPYAARPLARRLGIEHVVASDLEVGLDGRFTGDFCQPLCYGRGKIERAQRLAETHGFDLRDATFYSDSHSDIPLLEHVREPVVINPDPRLRRVARARNWRIETW